MKEYDVSYKNDPIGSDMDKNAENKKDGWYERGDKIQGRCKNIVVVTAVPGNDDETNHTNPNKNKTAKQNHIE